MLRRTFLAVVAVLAALALAAGGQVRAQPRTDLGGEDAAKVAAGARFSRPAVTRTDALRADGTRDQPFQLLACPSPPPGVLAPSLLLVAVLPGERELDPPVPRSCCPVAARAPPRA